MHLCFQYIKHISLNYHSTYRKKARARLRESAALKRPRRVRPGLQEPISYNRLATKEVSQSTYVSGCYGTRHEANVLFVLNVGSAE